MRILFVIPYVPNLVRVRPYQFIRNLASAGHQIVLCTLVSGRTDEEDVERLREFCEAVITVRQPKWRSLLNCGLAVFRGEPLQSVYSWQPELARIIENQLGSGVGNSYQAVHVEHLRGARYGLWARQVIEKLPVQNKPTLVWDSVDSISLLFSQASVQSSNFLSRFMTGFELGRTQKYEGYLTRTFEHILVTSNRDRDALVGLAGDSRVSEKIKIIPNGVDQDYFHPEPDYARDPNRIVISGKMSYHANVSMVERFVNQVFPKILSQKPEACLTIIGKDPPERIKKLSLHPAIEVTGTVADIRLFLWKGSVAVAPLPYGAGIQNKVLEAMGCGIPLVCSPQAVSALPVTHEQEVLVAGDDQEFANSVVRLLEDRQLANRISLAAHAFIQDHHRWETIVERLLEEYCESPRNNPSVTP